MSCFCGFLHRVCSASLTTLVFQSLARSDLTCSSCASLWASCARRYWIWSFVGDVLGALLAMVCDNCSCRNFLGLTAHSLCCPMRGKCARCQVQERVSQMLTLLDLWTLSLEPVSGYIRYALHKGLRVFNSHMHRGHMTKIHGNSSILGAARAKSLGVSSSLGAAKSLGIPGVFGCTMHKIGKMVSILRPARAKFPENSWEFWVHHFRRSANFTKFLLHCGPAIGLKEEKGKAGPYPLIFRFNSLQIRDLDNRCIYI